MVSGAVPSLFQLLARQRHSTVELAAHAGQQLALVGNEEGAPTAVGGYELVVGGNAAGDGGKALGHRQFARYYKQKYKPGDPRRSSAVSNVIAS